MSEEEIKNYMIPDEIKYICMECEDNIHKQEKGCAWRSLGNEYCDYVLNATKLYLDKDKEIERLNNIINELDNWLGKMILSWKDSENVSDNIYHERLAIQTVYFKLQELKDSDKE